MRISDSMIFAAAALNTGSARSALEEATRVASTGLRIQHPGDDPGAAGLLVSHQSALDRAQALSQVASRASDELGAADGALSQVTEALSRARELAVQMANASYSAADRAGAAAEVDGLGQQISSALNLKVGNRYVFGGSKDHAPPFAADGTYAGDALVRQLEIAPGVVQDASVRADVVIKGAGGGVDVFAAIAALSTALKANDAAGVRSSMDALTTATTQLATGRSAVGADIASFSAAKGAADAASLTEKTTVSGLQDADVVDAATRLALAQHALEASLAATSAGFKLSLLDPTGG